MSYLINSRKSLAQFFGENSELLDDMLSIAKPVTISAGSTILSTLDSKPEVYFIYNGKSHADIHSEDGQEIWVADYEPPTLIGELAMLGSQVRLADVVAITDVDILIFPADSFLGLMEKYGSLGIIISKLVASRVSKTTSRLFEVSALSAKSRVYQELLRLTESKAEDKYFMHPIPSLTDLAKRVNATRETVSRTINELEKKGVVSRESNKICIHNRDELLN